MKNEQKKIWVTVTGSDAVIRKGMMVEIHPIDSITRFDGKEYPTWIVAGTAPMSLFLLEGRDFVIEKEVNADLEDLINFANRLEELNNSFTREFVSIKNPLLLDVAAHLDRAARVLEAHLEQVKA